MTRPAAPTAKARSAVRGGAIGNYVDQFDIFLPVFALAPVSADLFGDAHRGASAGLVFVATLLGRPIGSTIFGPLADRRGRAAATRAALLGVGVSTLAIAAVPSHQSIGAWTFCLVVALRFLGGICLGGEYTAAIPLALEWSPPRRRGLVSGTIMAMSPAANVTITALTLGLRAVLGHDGYAAWGWRIPFVVGGLLALAMVAYYRRHVAESPLSGRSPRSPRARSALLSRADLRALARVFVLMTGLWLMTDMAIPVLTGALGAAGTHGDQHITMTMLCATAVSAPAMVLAGHGSTGYGRRRFFVVFGVMSAVAAPIGYAVASGTATLPTLVVAVAALQVVTVAAYGPVGAHLAEQFPTRVRSTGYGMGYSWSIVIPALYPYYLPALQDRFGETAAVAGLLAVAGVLVAVGGALRGRPVDPHEPSGFGDAVQRELPATTKESR